jgi:hypothetical protein
MSVPRFFAIVLLVLFSQRFEVSPLPEWTLYAFVYLMQFAVTYWASQWVFGAAVPAWREFGVVAVVFLGLEWFYEALMAVWFADQSWREVWGQVSWFTLWIFLLYLMGVFIAFERVRHRKPKGPLPPAEVPIEM